MTIDAESYLAGPLVDAGEVDLGDELHGWRRVWVILAAMYVQAVYTVLVGALLKRISSAPFRTIGSGFCTYVRRAKDCSVPVGH